MKNLKIIKRALILPGMVGLVLVLSFAFTFLSFDGLVEKVEFEQSISGLQSQINIQACQSASYVVNRPVEQSWDNYATIAGIFYRCSAGEQLTMDDISIVAMFTEATEEFLAYQ